MDYRNMARLAGTMILAPVAQNLTAHFGGRNRANPPVLCAPMDNSTPVPTSQFSGYQQLVVGMLAFLQFAVILDFMLMSPLGALIMPSLSVSPAQFGTVVSAYAFAAGISGLLTAGFADRFDRKKLLLFFCYGCCCCIG